MKLVKRIPSGAGLGGGSSDAAATLWALNQLWGLGWTTPQLIALAAQLGSDVPFFLHGGTALVEGRGDRVTPLPELPPRWVVLLTAASNLPEKTAVLYRALTSADYSDGSASHRLVERLSSGADLTETSLVNAFDRPARGLFPQLEQHRRVLHAAGATETHLSGSGPTLFSLERTAEDARRVASFLSATHTVVYVAETTSGCLFHKSRRHRSEDACSGADSPSA